jgi:hypothetical protein
MRKVPKAILAGMAGVLALALPGCLENPYPDSRLGEEKNVKKVSWRSRNPSIPILDLMFTRARQGKLSVSVRGANYDSAEFVAYITKYSPDNPPSLGTPFPNRVEFHGLALDPGAMYAPIGEVPDGTGGADLRDRDAGLILLKASGGGNPPVGKWGGVYAGKCTDPLRRTAPSKEGRLTGYIDADGYFCFRCSESEFEPGSVMTGRIGEDSLVSLLNHRPYGFYGWNGGLFDTTDIGPRFTWHGDSLSATFHWEGQDALQDTSRIEAVRIRPD